jgi:hypothetical protein
VSGTLREKILVVFLLSLTWTLVFIVVAYYTAGLGKLASLLTWILTALPYFKASWWAGREYGRKSK